MNIDNGFPSSGQDRKNMRFIKKYMKSRQQVAFNSAKFSHGKKTDTTYKLLPSVFAAYRQRVDRVRLSCDCPSSPRKSGTSLHGAER